MPPERKEVEAMARDGTGRGGARVGAGRKKKALTDRINDGGTAMVLDLPEPSEMSGEENAAGEGLPESEAEKRKKLLARRRCMKRLGNG